MNKKDNSQRRCDKCGRVWNVVAVGTCPHPLVQGLYGKQVCMYCCQHCRFHRRLTAEEDGLSAITCEFDLQMERMAQNDQFGS